MQPRLPTREGDFAGVKEDVRTSHLISLLWRQHHEDGTDLFYRGRPGGGHPGLLWPAARRGTRRARSAAAATRPIAKTVARPKSKPPAGLPTAKVERGNLICTVPAKGTVKLEEVEVGTQITGMIADFASDPDNPSKPLDCGSRVRKGMVLAHIDPTIYQAQVDYAEAALTAAKANLAQLKAHCDQTEQEWKRAKSLLPAKAIADTDYDLAVSNFRTAESNVIAGEAAVRENEASLLIAKTNLEYTVIKSPSDGVIIDRRVNVGQTVVASFNAPGLFLIAKDSRQVQVWASVDEADIGYIRPGAPVRFTLNACGDESFEGRVAQVRLSPTKQGRRGEIYGRRLRRTISAACCPI